MEFKINPVDFIENSSLYEINEMLALLDKCGYIDDYKADIIKKERSNNIAPCFEDEIFKALKMVFDNRDNLQYSDLRNLFRIGNVKFIR